MRYPFRTYGRTDTNYRKASLLKMHRVKIYLSMNRKHMHKNQGRKNTIFKKIVNLLN